MGWAKHFYGKTFGPDKECLFRQLHPVASTPNSPVVDDNLSGLNLNPVAIGGKGYYI
jgi:hypothetical protein